MNIFILFLLAHIVSQNHPFQDVSSGVEGKVVMVDTGSGQTQETVNLLPHGFAGSNPALPTKTVKVQEEVTEPEPTPEPTPTPVEVRPIYKGDPYCGIPWPRDIERYNNCMANKP